MSHLDEGTLHALLDGEIPSASLPAVERHLSQCEACQSRLTEARQFRDEAFGLIEALDATPVLAESAAGSAQFAAAPAPSFERRVAAVSAAPLPRRFVVPRWGRQLALAAVVILAVGLGVTLGNLTERPVDGLMARAEPSAPSSTGEADAAVPAPPASPTDPRAASSQSERDAGGRPSDRSKDKPAAPPKVLYALADSPAAARQEAKASEAPAPSRADKEEAVKTDQPSKKAADEAPSTIKEMAAAPPPETRTAPAANRVLGKSAFRQRSVDTTSLTRLVAGEATLERMMVGSAGVRRVSADAAIKALGGAIKLIDGLTADRYEQTGPVVRVVYRTAFGDLVLAQWRDDSLLKHRLLAPPTTPDDSVSAWLERIR